MNARAVDRVLGYYRLVDSGDIDGLVELFAADARYSRPGYHPLVGRAEIRRFYTSDRAIGRGRHEITSVLHQGNLVAVHGSFDGCLRDGSPAGVRFADFFVMGEQDTIVERDTFFFVPAL